MNDRPAARDFAAALLLEDDRKRAYVRDLLPEAREKLQDSRDRALLTELAYGVIRRRGTLDAVIQPHSRRPLERLSRPARVALRLATYQLLFLDRVPAAAAVHHAVGWTRRETHARTAGYVNAVLRAIAASVEGLALGPVRLRRDIPRDDGSAIRVKEDVLPDPATDLVGYLSASYAMPKWLVQRWLDRRGEEDTRVLLRAAITRPPLSLRSRIKREDLYHILEADKADVRAGPLATSLLVEGRGESVGIAAVERGEAWVQDATAHRAAPLVAPEAGERLLDLCAAPGGKSLHLADLMQEGTIVASDVSDERLAKVEGIRPWLPERISLELVRIPAEGALPFEAASFDRILVDAPCTNTGVLRRRVEVRWRLSPDDFAAFAVIQRDLLERAWPLLKSGGRLVYTTCSLATEENEDVVQAFIGAHPDATPGRSVEVLGGRDQDGGSCFAIEKDAAPS